MLPQMRKQHPDAVYHRLDSHQRHASLQDRAGAKRLLLKTAEENKNKNKFINVFMDMEGGDSVSGLGRKSTLTPFSDAHLRLQIPLMTFLLFSF